MATNSLLSTHASSDSGLRIHLHPLILLTISDYITRHTLRNFQNPIVGALLGRQTGRDISLEHAFECEVIENDGQFILHDAWFKDRLQQYKDVHLQPALELVGWFTTAPFTGPEADHLAIHQQISQNYNETAVLLAFHPSSVLEGAAVGGKLPLTIYESVYETGDSGDRSMDIDGQDAPLDLKFRELPYSIETEEAEMISVDFVARGGGNATAVDGTPKKDARGQASQTPIGEIDKKGKAPAKDSKPVDDSSILSAEDEELIASLTARANAVKMLHTRIRLLKSYLNSLPLSYLTTPIPSEENGENAKSPQHTDRSTSTLDINYRLLRSILALLSRLPLLLPPSHLQKIQQETLAEKADVELVALLGSMGKSVKEAREMGRKFGIVDSMRSLGRKSSMNVAGMDDDRWGADGMGGNGQDVMDGSYLM